VRGQLHALSIQKLVKKLFGKYPFGRPIRGQKYNMKQIRRQVVRVRGKWNRLRVMSSSRPSVVI
jgi:hypothetical protein